MNMKGSQEEHQRILHECLKLSAGLRCLRIWKQNTGSLKIGQRYVSFGLKGSADLSGILMDGTRLEVEVKSGNARQNEAQENFQRMIDAFRGVYMVVRSGDEFFGKLQEVCRLRGVKVQ